MKLRKIEFTQYEYDWESDTKKYAVVYDNQCIVAMFCTLFWAERFKAAVSLADGEKMEIMETVDFL